LNRNFYAAIAISQQNFIQEIQWQAGGRTERAAGRRQRAAGRGQKGKVDCISGCEPFFCPNPDFSR